MVVRYWLRASGLSLCLWATAGFSSPLVPGQQLDVHFSGLPVPASPTPGVDPVHAQTPPVGIARRCIADLACAGPATAEPQPLLSTPEVAPIYLVPAISVRLRLSDVQVPALMQPVSVPSFVIWVPNPLGDDIPLEVCPENCTVMSPASPQRPLTLTVEIKAGDWQLSRETAVPASGG